MVVVSTDGYGIQFPTLSKGHQVTVSAPCQVLCASNESGGQFQILDGKLLPHIRKISDVTELKI